MKSRKYKVIILLFAFMGGLMITVYLSRQANRANMDSANITTVPSITAAASPTSVWSALLQATPFAYFTPLPAPVQSPLDGTYAKVDQSWPQWWKCLRCADYRLAGGIWRLQFDKGVMRIFYEVNGWRSIASYTVSGDRLFIFNDPYCPEHVGEYRWSAIGGQLNLEAVNDVCSFDLRAKNLSNQPWLLCTESSQGEAVNVPGCVDRKQETAASLISSNTSVQVSVYGGDSRFFRKPPDVIVHANAADQTPPEGVRVSFAEESIPYGLQRVLWWNGTWLEASVEGSFEAIGVQFLGEQTIGWHACSSMGKKCGAATRLRFGRDMGDMAALLRFQDSCLVAIRFAWKAWGLIIGR